MLFTTNTFYAQAYAGEQVNLQFTHNAGMYTVQATQNETDDAEELAQLNKALAKFKYTNAPGHEGVAKALNLWSDEQIYIVAVGTQAYTV